MTLDEAIKHCEEKAKEQREKATSIARAKEPFYKYAECAECAKEHEQLANWLKELKAYKEIPQSDLISRSALKERIQLAPNKNYETWDELYDSIIYEIDNAPTVETKTTYDVNRAYDRGYITAMNAYARPKGDLISRKHLYRRIKTECNPYGKPTIDFESGKRVLDIIDNEPTVETYTEEDMRGDKNG